VSSESIVIFRTSSTGVVAAIQILLPLGVSLVKNQIVKHRRNGEDCFDSIHSFEDRIDTFHYYFEYYKVCTDEIIKYSRKKRKRREEIIYDNDVDNDDWCT
jgi:hypothetical protein